MKTVLFCGGLGMRIRDPSDAFPKPLVPVGDRPILWHVMKYYAHYGHRDFVLCLGYKGEAIEEYFRNDDGTRSRGGRSIELHSEDRNGWRITFADTGLHSSIGERLRQVKAHLAGENVFLANYADGLTDLHLPDLIDRSSSGKKVGSFLCVKPALSYHFVKTLGDGTVTEFVGANDLDIRINGGYFVFRKEIFDYIGDGEDLVEEPFHRLIEGGRLLGYRYDGFWKNMDTFKDKQALDDLSASGKAPWEVWKRSAASSGGG